MSKVLVIDDSEHVRHFLSEVLGDAGFDVSSAENGEQGLALFQTGRPDCVLLDVLMPGIDGFEVLKRIRETQEYLPVLIMTGDDPGWARRTCESYGATGFLSKTLFAEKLVETVEDVILSSQS
jgi:CheY-like chemotaxis protein